MFKKLKFSGLVMEVTLLVINVVVVISIIAIWQSKFYSSRIEKSYAIEKEAANQVDSNSDTSESSIN